MVHSPLRVMIVDWDFEFLSMVLGFSGYFLHYQRVAKKTFDLCLPNMSGI